MATVDWFGSAAPAAPPVTRPRRERPAAVPAPTPRPRRAPGHRAAGQRTARRRLTGGLIWISLFAVLLVGIVALNVAVLRAHVAVDKLQGQEAQLRQENSALASELSSASATLKIESAARGFGLVPAPSGDTSYLDLGRP